MRRFDLRQIMLRAWKNYRKGGVTFGEALHRSWLSAKAEEVNATRIREAQEAAGITEECKTWAGWKAAGQTVAHGSRALFQAVLLWGSRGDGATYKASFFGASQLENALPVLAH